MQTLKLEKSVFFIIRTKYKWTAYYPWEGCCLRFSFFAIPFDFFEADKYIMQGFHLSFDNSSYFVYPESTKYSSTERNEVALPKLELDQVEEYFRVRGLFVRAKQGREESLCSIRPAMSKSFVGRWEELMKLNKQICGHIPVITGDAGVGKTELAVAYADLYSENFPQGRFMIPMQGIHSWTEAMSKMVEWCNVCGIMTEQLGLPEDYNKLPPEETYMLAQGLTSILLTVPSLRTRAMPLEPSKVSSATPPWLTYSMPPVLAATDVVLPPPVTPI